MLFFGVVLGLAVLVAAYFFAIRPKCKAPATSGLFSCSCDASRHLEVDPSDKTACVCSDGYHMLSGQCVDSKTTCKSASDCGANETCKAGVCVPCGQESEDCCEGEKCASADLSCKSGTCQPCAHLGAKCCPDGYCHGDGIVCGSSGTCVSQCGTLGAQCCVGKTECQDGLECDEDLQPPLCKTASCGHKGQECCNSRFDSACWDSLFCTLDGCAESCGFPEDAPCCLDRESTQLMCDASKGFKCTTNKCQKTPDCGGDGQYCCLPAKGQPTCNEGLFCHDDGLCS